MTIKLNGVLTEIPIKEVNLTQLLKIAEIPFEGKGVAIARNNDLAPRSNWDNEWIQEGDEIEIVSARQGG